MSARLTVVNVVGKLTTMAHVVTRPNGTWEVRESRRTSRGPRSRTLASFRVLTPEVVERIESRASSPLDRDELTSRARRAGAPVAASRADELAAALLREISTGNRPRRALSRLLSDSLADAAGPSSDAAEPSAAAAGSIAETPGPLSHEAERMKMWAGATTRERADALEDLLGLADAIPSKKRAARSRFPKIDSVTSGDRQPDE